MSTFLEDAFSFNLQEQITWRIRELSELVRACADGTEARRLALSRAAIPVIYAHWEGYFVYSANAYLSFLAEKRIPMSQLKDEFWALNMKKRYKVNQINSEANFTNLLLDIRKDQDRQFKSGAFEKINGNSNLKMDVLRFCCKCLGVESSAFDEYADFIDDKLLTKRNFIAHGESLRFDPLDIPEYRNNVIDLMRATQNLFESCAYEKKYSRTAA